MKRVLKVLAGIVAGAMFLGFAVSLAERRKEKEETEKADQAEADSGQRNGKTTVHQPYGIYEAYLKRPFDCMVALVALLFLWPVLGIIALLVRAKLGSPVIFTQERPGRIDPKTGKEKIFKLYKFRTMTDARDENGVLLPDAERLTEFGRKLRATSLDELPELFNILKGEMSFVGPRPLMVEYLPCYTKEERRRHDVRPGLTGLAQIHGRNATTWEERFSWDVKYVENITFMKDIKIIFTTIMIVWKKEGINSEGFLAMEELISRGKRERSGKIN